MTTTTQRIYNFSAGPAVLPVEVLEQVQRDLLSLPGMDDETAFALAANGVRSADDLGELGADEVLEFGIEGMDAARAAALIMAARAEEIARLEREA